jgi:NADH-quinone oxidoreductase subunit G
VTLPVLVGDVLDDVVWLPTNSPGCHIYADLGVVPGDQVRLSTGGAA